MTLVCDLIFLLKNGEPLGFEDLGNTIKYTILIIRKLCTADLVTLGKSFDYSYC